MNDEELFHLALETPIGERSSFLDRACADDSERRSRVEALLRSHETSDSFLAGPAYGPGTPEGPDLDVTTDVEIGGIVEPIKSPGPAVDASGSQIGPYKLLQRLGEGGMGTVYMADQTRPVRRKVALKVIKSGMDSGQVIARFEAERQALALMDHVNIARVLDAGTTDSGRPYFVMELVHGVPITQYCDDNHLTPRERLTLFVPVCRAIQHAHQKGIIHRDIKPSNLMITSYDGNPVPKVIDFGVAKATEQKLTERTLFTHYGTLVGTLEYMSPEQAEMSALGVDTRSDIYSLGVLLYELLTGSTPLTRKRIKETGFGEILRLIKEEEPPRPSTRLSDSGGALASISAQRRMEPAKLTKIVRGELDWIVMKSLEKDRTRRYETAGDFAADVQRHLDDESVQACPPSAWYRFRKIARRNKAALVAAAMVSAALMAGTALASWQAIRANQEAATAKRITESFRQLVRLLNPDGDKDPDYVARIDEFAANFGEKLADQPEAAAELHTSIGRAYAVLGQQDKANKHLGRALELRRGVFGGQHREYADSLVDRARPDARSGLSELAAGETDLRQALAIYRARGVEGKPIIEALYTLQWSLVEQAHAGSPEKWDEIEPVFNEALAEAAKTPGVAFPKIASIHTGLVGAKIARGQFAEAEEIARRGLAMHLRLNRPDHPETAWAYHVLGDALRVQGKFAAALEANVNSLAIRRKSFPPGHAGIATALNAVISTLGMADESHALATIFPSPAAAGELELEFHDVLMKTKPSKLDDGDPVMAACRGLARFSVFYADLGVEFAAAGKADEAEESRQKAKALLDSLQSRLAGKSELLAYVYGYGTIAMEKAGQPREAKILGRNLLQMVPKTGGLLNEVAWFLIATEIPSQRDPALAVELAAKAVRANPRAGYFHNTLGVARYRAGDDKRASSDLETSVSLGNGGDPNDWLFLAMAQWRLGNKDAARDWYRKSVEWMDKNQPKNEELRRFRAEAAELLGVKDEKD